jgi:hypothetical protein
MKMKRIKRAVACSFAGAVLAFMMNNPGASVADATRLSAPGITQDQSPPARQQSQSQTLAGQPGKMAEEVFKNIQVLKGLPSQRLLGAMNFFARSLGVKCDHCHILNEFHKDEKATKLAARKMYQMVQLAHKALGNTQVSCFMCHRGKDQPEAMPVGIKTEVAEMMTDDARAAERVFKNIQSLKGVPAGRIMGIMTMFSKSLGVECSHCHDEAAFEKDDNPNKQKARVMLSMVDSIAREIYGGQTNINCYTCHRGEAKPVSMPPRPETPKKEGN